MANKRGDTDKRLQKNRGSEKRQVSSGSDSDHPNKKLVKIFDQNQLLSQASSVAMQDDGNEHQTGSDCESIISGIISSLSDDDRCLEIDVGVKPRTIKQNDVQKHAKIDLESLDEIPDKINQILITSTDSSRKLTTYNPMKIKLGIEQI